MKDVKPSRYKGSKAQFKAIDIADSICESGSFIIPQGDCPFSYSGRQCFESKESNDYIKFFRDTGIGLDAGCGMDTTLMDGFKNTNIVVEFVYSSSETRRKPIPNKNIKTLDDLFD